MGAMAATAMVTRTCGSGFSRDGFRTGMSHGTATAMLFSLMAPCGPLYFARRDIPVAGPTVSAGARYRGRAKNVAAEAAPTVLNQPCLRFRRG